MIIGKSLRLIYNQFGIIQILQSSPIPQTSIWLGNFFAVSYSKQALVATIKDWSESENILRVSKKRLSFFTLVVKKMKFLDLFMSSCKLFWDVILGRY